MSVLSDCVLSACLSVKHHQGVIHGAMWHFFFLWRKCPCPYFIIPTPPPPPHSSRFSLLAVQVPLPLSSEETPFFLFFIFCPFWPCFSLFLGVALGIRRFKGRRAKWEWELASLSSDGSIFSPWYAWFLLILPFFWFLSKMMFYVPLFCGLLFCFFFLAPMSLDLVWMSCKWVLFMLFPVCLLRFLVYVRWVSSFSFSFF